MTAPSAFFVSDAHLGVYRKGCDQREQLLVEFIESLHGRASHLFIVGDLFDFWFDYPRLIRADYFEILCALRALRRTGARIHYIAGNHDFALGSFLPQTLGLTVHEREFLGEVQGKRLLVQHGDGILKRDWSYRMLRAVLRNRFNQSLYRMVHPSMGLWLAAMASRTSRGINGGVLPRWALEGYREKARSMLAERQSDIVVLGHTHTPEILEGAPGVYCNSGEWMKLFSFAKLENGRMTLWNYERSGNHRQIAPQAW